MLDHQVHLGGWQVSPSDLHCPVQGICESIDEALEFYALRRTIDGKGITNPSQTRCALQTLNQAGQYAAASFAVS